MILLLSLLLACRCERQDHTPSDRPAAGGHRAVPPEDARRRSPEEIPKDKPETVVFIVLDTVRADHLSLCGYDRPTSPFLEHLRDEFQAAVSCHAYSPATWTLPSHAAYFTGKGIPDHGHDRLGARLPATTGPLLSEIFAERGYQSLMFAANTALEKSGLQRGFHRVRIANEMTELRFPNFGKELMDDLSKADASKPWFLFVNLIDAHDPYPKIPEGVSWVPPQDLLPFDVRKPEADTPYHQFLAGDLPAEKAERYLAAIRNGYDYGIWMEDQNVHAVFQTLRRVGRLPGPIRVVITADHGEFIGEHGLLRHPTYLWEPAAHVPLIYFDNLAEKPVTFPEPVSALSAFYLLRDGRMPEPALPVQTWARVMDDRPVKPGEDSYARWGTAGDKLIWRQGAVERYDLRADPAEATPAPVPQPDAAFSAEVERYRAYLETSSKAPLDAETVQSLKELGYIH